jgi:hypothetical protein
MVKTLLILAVITLARNQESIIFFDSINIKLLRRTRTEVLLKTHETPPFQKWEVAKFLSPPRGPLQAQAVKP